MSDALTRASNPPVKTRSQSLLPTSGATGEFLAFVLGDETYALPLASVREIMRVPPVTEVPRAPRAVIGIVSVRGKVITVYDAKARLRLGNTARATSSRLLLVATDDEQVGLVVDRILQVYKLSGSQVEYAAKIGGDTADYILGIGRPQASKALDKVEAEPTPAVSYRGRQQGKDQDQLMLILLDPIALLRG